MNQKQSANLITLLAISSVLLLTLGITSSSMLNSAYAVQGIKSIFNEKFVKSQPSLQPTIVKLSQSHKWEYLSELKTSHMTTFVHMDLFSLAHKNIHV